MLRGEGQQAGAASSERLEGTACGIGVLPEPTISERARLPIPLGWYFAAADMVSVPPRLRSTVPLAEIEIVAEIRKGNEDSGSSVDDQHRVDRLIRILLNGNGQALGIVRFQQLLIVLSA